MRGLVAGGPSLFLDDQIALDREHAACLAEIEQLDQLGIDVELAAVLAQPAGDAEAQPFAPIRKPERGVEPSCDEAAAADGTTVALTGHVTVASFGRDSQVAVQCRDARCRHTTLVMTRRYPVPTYSPRADY